MKKVNKLCFIFAFVFGIFIVSSSYAYNETYSNFSDYETNCIKNYVSSSYDDGYLVFCSRQGDDGYLIVGISADVRNSIYISDFGTGQAFISFPRTFVVYHGGYFDNSGNWVDRYSGSEYNNISNLYENGTCFWANFDLFSDSSCNIENIFYNYSIPLKLVNSSPTSEPVEIFTDRWYTNDYFLYYSIDNINFYKCNRTEDYGDNEFSFWVQVSSNGTHYFKLIRNDVDCSYTSIRITNCFSSDDLGLFNDNVLQPIMSFEKDGVNLYYRCQSLNNEQSSRYVLYYSTVVNSDSNFTACHLMNDYNSMTKEDNYKYRFLLSEDGMYYYMFYDKYTDKYSKVCSFTYNSQFSEEYFSIATTAGSDDFKDILLRKFGIFYNLRFFMTQFWNSLSVDSIPDFCVALPNFLGTSLTLTAIDFSFYDNYRVFIHSFIIGVSYFYFVRYLMKVIPSVIHR